MLKSAAAKKKLMKTYSPETSVDTVWWRTLILVSFTMLCIGGISLLRRLRAGQALPNMTSVQINASSAKTALIHVVSIALPIYSGMIIGGTMVALALGLTYAAGIPVIFNQGEKSASLQERLGRKKASLFVLSLFVVLNVLGYDFPIDTQPFRGYVALAVSIFVLRPPFPAARDSIPATQKPSVDSASQLGDFFSALADQQTLALLRSPLTASPEDVQLTLVAGGGVAILAILTSPFNDSQVSFGFFDLIKALAVAGTFALSYTFSSPFGLRSRQKVGFVAAALVMVLTSAAPHEETSRIAHLSWSILATGCYFAALFDDPKPGEPTRFKTEMSFVTKFLIQQGESWPILHSILLEDDSRRIFYFMWYVFLSELESFMLTKQVLILASCLSN
jgi:zinc transporter 5/7